MTRGSATDEHCYALREKVRGDVRQRKDRDDVFSTSAARYWSAIDDLCRAIDQGDASIGLPPYNGGLFDRKRIPLLANIRLGDTGWFCPGNMGE